MRGDDGSQAAQCSPCTFFVLCALMSSAVAMHITSLIRTSQPQSPLTAPVTPVQANTPRVKPHTRLEAVSTRRGYGTSCAVLGVCAIRRLMNHGIGARLL